MSATPEGYRPNDGTQKLADLHNKAYEEVYEVSHLTPDAARQRLDRIRKWRFQRDLFNQNSYEIAKIEQKLIAHLRALGEDVF
jgi:hypothetical protein